MVGQSTAMGTQSPRRPGWYLVIAALMLGVYLFAPRPYHGVDDWPRTGPAQIAGDELIYLTLPDGRRRGLALQRFSLTRHQLVRTIPITVPAGSMFKSAYAVRGGFLLDLRNRLRFL